MFTAIWILAAHFIADFVLQARWIGLNKSKNEWVLLLHIAIYTAAMSVMLLPLDLPPIFFAINAAAHWLTDWCSSRLGGYFFKKNNLYMFWNVIGLDQLAHGAFLLYTLSEFT